MYLVCPIGPFFLREPLISRSSVAPPHHQQHFPAHPPPKFILQPIKPHRVYSNTNNSFTWLSIIGYCLAAIQLDSHQPSEFVPSLTRNAAALFEDCIRAITHFVGNCSAITWFVGNCSLKSSQLDTIGQHSAFCAQFTSFTILSMPYPGQHESSAT